ncbi:MAG: membrane protein insertase YidC [Myxococcota bacterium]|jgi:YidC/Oxa1 family membrane protein insertase|nr:membrane protein insertase YidC [Myxococcota bacterium]
MNEQQRVFLAISLCLAILIGWQYLFAPPPQQPVGAGEDFIATPKAEKESSGVAQTKTEKSGVAVLAEETTLNQGDKPEALEVQEKQVALQVKDLKTENFSLTIDNGLNVEGTSDKNILGLKKLELLKYKESADEEGERSRVNLIDKYDSGESRQALIKWHLGEYKSPRMEEVASSEGTLFRGQSAKGLTTNVLIEPDEESYAIHYTLSVLNNSLVTLPVDATLILALNQAESASSGSMMAAAGAQPMQGRCLLGEEIEEYDINELQEEDDDGQSGWRSQGNQKLHWAGIDRQYFVLAAAPEKPGSAKCSMNAYGEHLEVHVHFAQELIAPEGEWNAKFTLYAGPKKVERLEEVGKTLGSFVDYNIMGLPLGFIARPMIYFLNIFHGWTASWGIAIILLTFFVKALLLPVTIKSTVSMRKMQLLRPELDKLKARFGADRERMNVEQMKLFKEKGVNPLGGCLPMLLQMPVWFALYRSLWSAVDIYQQSFAWIPDLTAKEPFPFMAVAIGGLTVLQQKLTPTSVDNAQARMMMIIMPIMLMVFMIALPSGLVLYILVNSVLTLFQQLIINNMKITI